MQIQLVDAETPLKGRFCLRFRKGRRAELRFCDGTVPASLTALGLEGALLAPRDAWPAGLPGRRVLLWWRDLGHPQGLRGRVVGIGPEGLRLAFTLEPDMREVLMGAFRG
ncbi:MAG: hypothetical protein KDG89_16475 [Geminicoccaceae bacterium]|nr:hypothetical protein [Geminicoccaceae bacterium]